MSIDALHALTRPHCCSSADTNPCVALRSPLLTMPAYIQLAFSKLVIFCSNPNVADLCRRRRAQSCSHRKRIKASASHCTSPGTWCRPASQGRLSQSALPCRPWWTCAAGGTPLRAPSVNAQTHPRCEIILYQKLGLNTPGPVLLPYRPPCTPPLPANPALNAL